MKPQNVYSFICRRHIKHSLPLRYLNKYWLWKSATYILKNLNIVLFSAKSMVKGSKGDSSNDPKVNNCDELMWASRANFVMCDYAALYYRCIWRDLVREGERGKERKEDDSYRQLLKNSKSNLPCLHTSW